MEHMLGEKLLEIGLREMYGKDLSLSPEEPGSMATVFCAGAGNPL